MAISHWQDRLGKPIPMLVLTGRTDPASVEWLSGQQFPWLTKPAEPDAIAARIMALLATSAPASGEVTGKPEVSIRP